MTIVEGTNPYPWPYDGRFDPTRCALVITGAQRAWVETSINVALATATIEAVSHSLTCRGGYVLGVTHRNIARRSRHCVLPPSDGDPTGSAIALSTPTMTIVAHGVDGFTGSGLDRVLRELRVESLVFAGFGAEATVDSTLRSANDRGYECLVLVDGVAPFDEVTGAHALSSVTMSGGIFGALGTSQQLLATLEQFPIGSHADAVANCTAMEEKS